MIPHVGRGISQQALLLLLLLLIRRRGSSWCGGGAGARCRLWTGGGEGVVEWRRGGAGGRRNDAIVAGIVHVVAHLLVEGRHWSTALVLKCEAHVESIAYEAIVRHRCAQAAEQCVAARRRRQTTTTTTALHSVGGSGSGNRRHLAALHRAQTLHIVITVAARVVGR